MRIFFVSLALLAAGSAGAQTITSVSNAASYMPRGAVNAGIAQGSMFVIKGSALGPGTFAVATTFPLPAVIGGTSVRVTSGGTTVDCIMYYAGATQIAAILPSNTPVGTASVIVTVNGRASQPFQFPVVRNGFGVFTIPQSGVGEAIATSGSGFVSPLNAANPGDIIGFWGTGLGPVSGNEANAAQQTDLTAIPVEAWVGGKPAEVLFRGRNGCCSSVDTVYVRIPADVSGCATPVVFRIGATLSNMVTVAVAGNGSTCTPTDPALDPARLTATLSGPDARFGIVRLFRQRSVNVPRGLPLSRVDSADGIFHLSTVAPGALGLGPAIDVPPPGSCLMDTFPTIGGPLPLFTYSPLDAGPALALNGPQGQRTLPRSTLSGQLAYGTGFGTNTFFVDGAYTISAPGGTAGAANTFSAFTANATFPPPIVWTDQTTITTVNRSQGLTVNWTGSDPYSFVLIEASTTSSDNFDLSVDVSVTCTARASDRTFTIPAYLLSAMPATPSLGAGLLRIQGISSRALSMGSGVGFGMIHAYDISAAVVRFQ